MTGQDRRHLKALVDQHVRATTSVPVRVGIHRATYSSGGSTRDSAAHQWLAELDKRNLARRERDRAKREQAA